MSDEANQINQDEIEQLLRQAQAADTAAPAEAPASQEAAKVEKPAGSPAHDRRAADPADFEPATPASDADDGQNDIDYLLNQAEAALASLDSPSQNLPNDVAPFEFKDLTGSPPSSESATLELVRNVPLDLKIELGRTHMRLEEVLRLKKGAVVPLDKLAGDPVDIYANGRLIARGEVLVLNDNFCVRVAELIVGETAVA